MSDALRDALIGKVAKFWRRTDSGGWPFYVLLLDYQEGLFHVRSLDREHELESVESRERWWIPAITPSKIEIMTEAMIRNEADRMLPRDEWGPIGPRQGGSRTVWLIRVKDRGWVERFASDSPEFLDHYITGIVERAMTFASEKDAEDFAEPLRKSPYRLEVVPWEIRPA